MELLMPIVGIVVASLAFFGVLGWLVSRLAGSVDQEVAVAMSAQARCAPQPMAEAPASQPTETPSEPAQAPAPIEADVATESNVPSLDDEVAAPQTLIATEDETEDAPMPDPFAPATVAAEPPAAVAEVPESLPSLLDAPAPAPEAEEPSEAVVMSRFGKVNAAQRNNVDFLALLRAKS